MSEKEIEKIVENAKVIVNGYAFSRREDGFIDVVNIEYPDSVMVIRDNCELIATNMDEIEQKIVLELSHKNLQFMEA